MNNIETISYVGAMKLALNALETNNKAWKSLADSGDAGWWEAEEQPFYDISVKAITALRQAINAAEQREQAQQAEPDYYGLTKDHLWMSITKDHYNRLKPEFRMACYTSPPLRQPLTVERVFQIADQHPVEGFDPDIMAFARAIEAAHGIKENT